MAAGAHRRQQAGARITTSSCRQTRSRIFSSSLAAQNLRRRVCAICSGTESYYQHIILEFLQICRAVAVGFAIMGFIGYLVKLIHIPMYVLRLSSPGLY